MSFRTEVKMGSDGVFEELNEQIAAEEQCHCTDDRFGRGPAAQIRSPNANSLRKYLQEDGCHHEAGAERNQVLKKALATAMRPPLDEQKAANKISECG